MIFNSKYLVSSSTFDQQPILQDNLINDVITDFISNDEPSLEKNKAEQETTAYLLQKYLAKIILDIKYEENVSQSCVDKILFKFKKYFNDVLDIGLKEVNSIYYASIQ